MANTITLSSLAREIESISGHPAMIADIDERRVEFSPALKELLKTAPGQNHSSQLDEIMHELDSFQRKEIRRKLRSTLASGKSNYLEMSITIGGQKLILGITMNQNSSIAAGRRLLFVKAINKTEHKKQRQQPGTTREQMKRTLNSAPDPIIITSVKGKIIDFNPATLNFLALDRDDIQGADIWSFIKNGNKETFAALADRTIRRSYSRESNVVFKSGKNTTRYAEISSSVVYEEDTPHFISLFIRDVSENIIYQKQLETEKRKAQESDRLKTAFLANMSHEIRTPMNAIIGFSELLNDPDTSKKERKEYVNLINTNSTELLNLIDDIIDVAKIEAGQVQIRKTVCPLEQIFNDLRAHFSQLIQAEQKPVRLKTEIPEKYQKLQIVSDAYRLRQVLQNLISNGIKFTEEGSVSFGFEIPRGLSSPEIRFYIRDTGIGIAEDKQEQIFERFRQVEESHVRKYNGAGLGLTLCKKLVELLGGSIGVESAPGKGSEFYFSLPLEVADFNKPETTEKHQLRPYDWNNKTILVAEDIEANYLYIEAVLMQTQANVIWTTDGDLTAEKCLKDNSIDLVLMDIQMPGLNGYQATRIIKKQRPRLPVIALTAFASNNEKEKSIEAGCDDYLTKPIRPQQLLDTMNRYLQ